MSASDPRDLTSVRQEIDNIDRTIVDLVNRRLRLATEIGLIKGADGRPYFTPERERQVIENVRRANEGPLSDAQIDAIFREIVSAARATEKALEIAFWGPEGSFSHLAALQAFGSSVLLQPQVSIRDCFDSVERRSADYAVVPIENLIAGIIPETLDAFPVTNVKICAEMFLPIRHHLVSTCEDIADVRRVYAGPQPASQCNQWLRLHLPGVEIVSIAPTSLALQYALNDPEGAAIANEVGAAMASLPILVDRIEDDPRNRTRFLVIGFNEPAQTGRDKTSLMFNLRNKPGELFHALGALNDHGVNLTMIESRPAPRSEFEYIFYIDCAGHRRDDRIRKAIDALRALTLETVVLGSYPSSEEEA